MAQAIFSVGLSLPGNVAEHVAFRSDRSLFDADIVLFRPDISGYSSYESYSGEPLVSESESVALMRDMAHWKAELLSVVNAGKIVFVFLPKPRSVYYHTGTRSHSGTGRSRVTTRHVAPTSSYDCLPVTLSGLTPRSGTEISPMGDLGPIAAYWSEFGATSAYEVYFDATGLTALLGTKNREKAVGGLVRSKAGGALVLLPPVKWDEEALTFSRGASTYWRKEGVTLGKRLVSSLVEISKVLRQRGRRSPAPAWTSNPDYLLPTENTILTQISDIDQRVGKLADKRKKLESELADARELYGLLYETGAPLEHAIRLALTLLGFKAEPFREGESEFDVVFSSDEGRFLGEAEGKDSKAINIDKMSQLERNLQEDFAREEVTEFAKGALFGNASRLTPPAERTVYFTDKCISAAKRLRVALVRTPDLFPIARYLSATADPPFAAACRRAIFETEGEVVQFPALPAASGEGLP
jgi:hypothetical protein